MQHPVQGAGIARKSCLPLTPEDDSATMGVGDIASHRCSKQPNSTLELSVDTQDKSLEINLSVVLLLQH